MVIPIAAPAQQEDKVRAEPKTRLVPYITARQMQQTKRVTCIRVRQV